MTKQHITFRKHLLPLLLTILLPGTSITITAAERLCSSPGFNECNYDGEVGCCDVAKTMRTCPTGYYMCGQENLVGVQPQQLVPGGMVVGSMEGVVEEGFGAACCPNFYTCMPNPSCVSTVTATNAITITTISTLVSVSVSVSVSKEWVTEIRTQTQNQTITVAPPSTSPPDNTITGPPTFPTFTNVEPTLLPTDTDGSTTIPSSKSPSTTTIELAGSEVNIFPTFAAKLNIGFPGMIDLKSQRSTRRWSAFSPGVKAGICVGAVVGTVILTIAGYFIVLAIIRRRRKKIGESTASAGGRGVPVGELGANEEAEGEKRHWYARRWGKRRSLLEIVTRRNKPTRPAELEVPEKKSDPSPHSSLSTPLAYRFHGGIAEVAGSTVTVELANTPVAELSVEDVKRQS